MHSRIASMEGVDGCTGVGFVVGFPLPPPPVGHLDALDMVTSCPQYLAQSNRLGFVYVTPSEPHTGLYSGVVGQLLMHESKSVALALSCLVTVVDTVLDRVVFVTVVLLVVRGGGDGGVRPGLGLFLGGSVCLS